MSFDKGMYGNWILRLGGTMTEDEIRRAVNCLDKYEEAVEKMLKRMADRERDIAAASLSEAVNSAISREGK